MTTSLQPGAGFVAVHGVLDAARTLGEVMPLLASRIGCDLEGIELAARSAADVVRVPADARRPGPDLRAVADTALLRAGGEGPLVFRDRSGPIALAVDGRATNAGVLRAALMARGAVFNGSGIAELIVHLIAHSEQRTVMNRLLHALQRIEGGFALALLTGDLLVLARDPRGLRPLCVGRRGGGWVSGPEASMLRASGVLSIREVQAGEVLVLDAAGGEGSAAGLEALRPFAKQVVRPCAAEWLATASADAEVSGVDVVEVRDRLGFDLAGTFPARADAVVPLPGSEALAGGFARGMNTRVLHALVRTGPAVRCSGAVRGMRVALVVDLLATGERARRAVAALRSAGASEVLVRVGTMPVSGPCLYGTVTPPEEELLAHRFEIPRMRAWLDADSLAHPERATMLGAAGRGAQGCCDGCFSGDYPVVPLDPQLPLFPKAARV